jgi:chemotaxis protein histidine kinase CheA/ActR/RegA family two-component response regulator
MAGQDRIVGYFLDESLEHLRVIEEGLVSPNLLSQPAHLKEVFRAAHSLKGGAAMLELDTIQKISHYFEQAFKQIKDQSLLVDEPLQALLLEGLELLRAAIQFLREQQTPPSSLAQAAVFEQIQAYLSRQSVTTPLNQLDKNMLDSEPLSNTWPLLDLGEHHNIGNFMLDPQVELSEPAEVYDLGDFMQLFDEELPVDGTWVQDEDVLHIEEFSDVDHQSAIDLFAHTADQQQSASLWDADIFARPLPALTLEEPLISATHQHLPQFKFEEPSSSELFIEDEATTDYLAGTTPDIDWSGLLADIPSAAVVDYQEPVPAETASDWQQLLDDPFALIDRGAVALPDNRAAWENDLELADFFGIDPPPLMNPPDLPTLDELMAKSLSTSAPKQEITPLDLEDWRELSIFDDLLTDTHTTDVDISELNQIVINGNLDPESELKLETMEDLSDFSPASVGSNQIDALDNFRTEAQKRLINLENLNSFTETAMLHGDISIDDIQLSGELTDLDLDLLDLSATGNLHDDDFAALDLSFLADHLGNDHVQHAELDALNLDDLEIFPLVPLTTTDLNAVDILGDAALDELDGLLESPSTVEPLASFTSLDSILATQDDDEFNQIEKMLQHSDSNKSERVVVSKPSSRSKKQRTFEQTMRVSVKSLNNLNNLAGELVVNRNTLEQDQNRLRMFVDKLLLEVQNLNEVGKSMQDLYEKSLLESSLLANRQHQQTKPAAPSEYDAEGTMAEIEYDPLEMDRFTPIHLISQQMIELTVRIRESTSDIEFVVDNSTEVTRSLRQINSQLQEDLNKSRMLQFAQTADRLQRGVRDNGLKYGKQVELHVEGRDTMIDKVILESLNDPLVHMVNNAIAHGIESPEVRLAAGKPAMGSVMIRAVHQGTQTIISLQDDGAGVDIERVKAKAIENGVITPAQAVTMTKTEVYDLLFLPSFSTKDQADELAGRGVGMDVVLTSLQEIRGTITTESTLGQGTTFTIRLPLALSIAKSLIAVNKDASIAFPMDGIEDSQDIKPEEVVINAAGQKCFQWRNQLMPFRPLSDLLSFNRPSRRISYYNHLEEEEERVALIVLRSGGHLIAVEVDRVIGEQEIVIKPLQGPAPKPVGVAGATVLGDGRIIPIADVVELIDLANGVISKQNSGLWSMNVVVDEQPAQREPMVLIIDDSITVRQLLSLTFTRAGYRVEQARDGQEAWDKLRAGLPCDIIFCDIEMPRMDGLELLAKVQQDETLKKLPMAMLTSRGSDRHRQIAADLGASGYFIKPYLEDALLAAVKRMMKGEVLAIV